MTYQVANPLQTDYPDASASTTDYRRLLRPPPGNFSVFGMRGTGKATWAGTWFPDAHVVDLGDARRCHQLLADPALLARDVREAPSHLTVVVDGVQRAGPLLGELWRLTPLANWLREHARSRFLLTAPPLRLPGAVGSPVTPIATV